MHCAETYRNRVKQAPKHKDSIFVGIAEAIALCGTIEDLQELVAEYEKEETNSEQLTKSI